MNYTKEEIRWEEEKNHQVDRKKKLKRMGTNERLARLYLLLESNASVLDSHQ